MILYIVHLKDNGRHKVPKQDKDNELGLYNVEGSYMVWTISEFLKHKTNNPLYGILTVANQNTTHEMR